MTAEERAEQLLWIEITDLPELANRFYTYFIQRHEYCMENAVTALSIYAQFVEGLECTDEFNKIREDDVKWFRENSSPSNKGDDDF